MCTIEELLVAERKRLGLSQTAMAEAGGVSLRSQANYESGERSPDGHYWSKIALIGADVQYILTGIRSPTYQLVSEPVPKPLAVDAEIGPSECRESTSGGHDVQAEHSDTVALHSHAFVPTAQQARELDKEQIWHAWRDVPDEAKGLVWALMAQLAPHIDMGARHPLEGLVDPDNPDSPVERRLPGKKRITKKKVKG